MAGRRPIGRRPALLAGLGVLVSAAACGRSANTSAEPNSIPPGVPKAGAELIALENRFGGRIGVYVLDTGGGATIGHRADEPFPMCSTAKALAVAAVLLRRHSFPGLLDQVVRATCSSMRSAARTRSLSWRAPWEIR